MSKEFIENYINADVGEEENVDEFTGKEKSETMVNKIGGFEKMEPFHLDSHTRDVIKEHFIKRDFEVIEMTDAYIKVKSSSGKTMTIENEVAAKYFTSV